MRRVISLLLLVVSLGACVAPHGQSDTLYIDHVWGLQEFSTETVEGAAEILGMEIIVGDREQDQGAIAAFVTDDGVLACGGSEVQNTCNPIIWAQDDSEMLAHEIGHALGLGHAHDVDNLMHPDVSPGVTEFDLDDEQIDVMRTWAWWLETGCEDRR